MSHTRIRQEIDKLASTTKSALEKDCVNILLNNIDDLTDDEIKAGFKDFMRYGCASGMVRELTHYHDTAAFYKRHFEEIHALIEQDRKEAGVSPLRALANKSPLYNWLAWYAFEKIIRNIADLLGI